MTPQPAAMYPDPRVLLSPLRFVLNETQAEKIAFERVRLNLDQIGGWKQGQRKPPTRS